MNDFSFHYFSPFLVAVTRSTLRRYAYSIELEITRGLEILGKFVVYIYACNDD